MQQRSVTSLLNFNRSPIEKRYRSPALVGELARVLFTAHGRQRWNQRFKCLQSTNDRSTRPEAGVVGARSTFHAQALTRRVPFHMDMNPPTVSQQRVSTARRARRTL